MTNKTKKSSNNNQAVSEAVLTMNSPEVIAETHKHMLHSALFLSVLLNVTVLIIWLIARTTTQFDAELTSIIFSR